MKYRILIEQGEDRIFVVEVPSLPGCFSRGRTRQEAIDNAKEAIAAYLDSLAAHDEPIPPPITEELVEVAISQGCTNSLAVRSFAH
ncbi:MAG: type II toxin-antitoxin system HicB family antitoxin [Thermodesulfobacteriota bacterium]